MWRSFPASPSALTPSGKVALEPGESREAEFRLNARSFAIYHPEKREWFVVPGRYRLRFGASSRDIRQEAVVER